MAANRLVDLTSLVPGMRQCTITVGENGKTVLHAESGTVKIDRELTSSEMNRLSLIFGQCQSVGRKQTDEDCGNGDRHRGDTAGFAELRARDGG